MPVTQRQIAEKAGVSQVAVSQVLHRSHRSRISVETREEILRVARELGYMPRNHTTHTIGFVVPTPTLQNPADALYFLHVEAELRRRGYRLFLANTEDTPALPLHELLTPKTVDGLFFMNWSQALYDRLQTTRIPCVLASEEDVAPQVEQVAMDMEGTLVNVLSYLKGKGHRRLAFLNGNPAKPYYHRLRSALLRAAARCEVPRDHLDIIETRPSRCPSVLLEKMRGPLPPTVAILADNPRVLAVYCGLLTAGVRLPDELSLLSLSDNDQYQDLQPSLTATSAAGPTLAKRAVGRLIQLIRDPNLNPRHEYLAGEIVPRHSVRNL